MQEQGLGGYQLLRYDSALLRQLHDASETHLHYRIWSDGGDVVDVIAREEPTVAWD